MYGKTSVSPWIKAESKTQEKKEAGHSKNGCQKLMTWSCAGSTQDRIWNCPDMGQASTMNPSADPAHLEILQREDLFKGGLRLQEESTTITAIVKDGFESKCEWYNIATVMFIQDKEFLQSNIYKTQVILMVET